jgi:hypothetical protein
MGETRNPNRFLMLKPLGIYPFGKSGRKWNDNTGNNIK